MMKKKVKLSFISGGITMKKNVLFLTLAAFLLATPPSLCVQAETQNPQTTYEYEVYNTMQQGILYDSMEYFVFGSEFISDLTTNGSPRYTLLKQLGIGLTIENRRAYIFTDAETYDKMDIHISAELQQYVNFKWKTIKTFTNSETNSNYCYIQEQYALSSGYDYRVVTKVTVDDGKNTETVTKNGSGKFCN